MRCHCNLLITTTILQYLPYSYHVAYCSKQDEYVENGMYVFYFVETVKDCSGDVCHAFAYNP